MPSRVKGALACYKMELMDQSSAVLALGRFLGDIGLDKVCLGELPKEELDACDPETFDWGVTVRDGVTGREYYITSSRKSPESFEDSSERSYVAWYHKDIPGGYESPPDVDTIVTEESLRLYGSVRQVVEDIFEHRLEYAHLRFGGTVED